VPRGENWSSESHVAVTSLGRSLSGCMTREVSREQDYLVGGRFSSAAALTDGEDGEDGEDGQDGHVQEDKASLMCSRSGQSGGRPRSAIWRTGPQGHRASAGHLQRPRYLPFAVSTRRQPFTDSGSALDHLLTSVSYAVGYRREAGQMDKTFDQRQGGSVRGSQHGTLATKGNWPRRRGR
jgi:hypothetical protein